MIGIHGAHDGETRQLLPETGVQVAAFYRQQLGAKMDSGLLRESLYGLKDESVMLVIPELQRLPIRERNARFCPSLRARSPQCKHYRGQTAFTLGLVTDGRTERVDLPPELRQRTKPEPPP